MGANFGNAYLQALTKEKLYIVACPDFEELQRYVFVMYKALYGTRSGGECWYDKPFDILQQMDLLQAPLFWKGGTGELTAKTKGSGIISPKLGLSLPLFKKNSIPNGGGCVPTTKGFVHIPKGCIPTPKGCVPTPNRQIGLYSRP